MYKIQQCVDKWKEKLPEAHESMPTFYRHYELMDQNKFNWIHEANTESIDFRKLKDFLKKLKAICDRDINRNYKLPFIF